MYDIAFYEAETSIALNSAAVVLPDLLSTYEIRSLIDIGCGTGGWAWTAQSLGVPSVGVDWDVPEGLMLPITFRDADLKGGYRCDGFDMAVCLEVAEHLPDTAAPGLVKGLCRARVVLFSAATPGQPGVGHINCQPHDYWHRLFAEDGFTASHIGPNYTDPVADFYIRNMHLYTKDEQ